MRAEDLAALIRRLPDAGGGGNVTVPHKEIAARCGGPSRDAGADGRRRATPSGARTARRWATTPTSPGLLEALHQLEVPAGAVAHRRAPAAGRGRPWSPRREHGRRDCSRLAGSAPAECVRALDTVRAALRCAGPAELPGADQHHPARPRRRRSASARAGAVPRRGRRARHGVCARRDRWVRACAPRVRRAADGRAMLVAQGAAALRALVSRQARPGRGHARRGRCARFARDCALARRRALAAAAGVPPVRRAGARPRQGDALVCGALPLALASRARSAVPPLRTARLRRSRLPALRGMARRARAGPQRGLAARARRASRGAPAQVRGLVRGLPRRWPTRCGGLEPLTAAGILDTDPAGRAAARVAGLQPERADRRGSRRAAPARRSGCDVLRRARETPTQTALTPEARQANVAGAFEALGGDRTQRGAGGRRLHHRRHAGGGRGGAQSPPAPSEWRR